METREHLEFYRVDQSGPTKRILIPAIALLTVGPPMVIFSAAAKKFPSSGTVGAFGAALMIAGLVTGFLGIALLMLDDRYVAVVAGGILVHLDKEETFFPWEALQGIRCEGAILLLILREAEPAASAAAGAPVGAAASGQSVRELRLPFSKARVPQIAARLEEWRRRDAWNLAPLPPS
ncbi:hypothetical protein [Pendulispora albinea]|uniref:Uncharacterized protein n=1 Tax=Pendulispora albinea TaxID=2741071 RepID=A0ABZ2M562_9BACT